jgi:hypothetical protein
MILRIPPDLDDDPRLMVAVSCIVAAVAEARRPELVHVVRIKNVFDHEWLRYSGQGRVPFPDFKIHTALDSFWQDYLTFPPFTPSRVVAEVSFFREADGSYTRCVPGIAFHHRSRGHSSANLHRRVASEAPSAVFAWLSTGSCQSGRATMMLYEVFAGGDRTWHSSFRSGGELGWVVHLTKGIDRETLARQFESYMSVAAAASAEPSVEGQNRA